VVFYLSNLSTDIYIYHSGLWVDALFARNCFSWISWHTSNWIVYPLVRRFHQELYEKDERSSTELIIKFRHYIKYKIYDTARKQGRRTVVVRTIPHPSPMFHSMVLMVCLLSAYPVFSKQFDINLPPIRYPPPWMISYCNSMLPSLWCCHVMYKLMYFSIRISTVPPVSVMVRVTVSFMFLCFEINYH